MATNEVVQAAFIAPAPIHADRPMRGFAVHTEQNQRKSMEDRVSVWEILPGFPEQAALVCVFDGHGGSCVADYCAQHAANAVMCASRDVTARLRRRDEATSAESGSASTAVAAATPTPTPTPVATAEAPSIAVPAGGEARSRWFGAVLKRAFRLLDRGACAHADRVQPDAIVGTTAVVAVVTTDHLYVANAGDSRAVQVRRYPDGTCRARALTRDHKPSREDERTRILNAGGRVVYTEDCARVDGVLATSRAIGDRRLKPHVSAEPEVTVARRLPADSLTRDYLLLATDGLWDDVGVDETSALVSRLHAAIEAAPDATASSASSTPGAAAPASAPDTPASSPTPRVLHAASRPTACAAAAADDDAAALPAGQASAVAKCSSGAPAAGPAADSPAAPAMPTPCRPPPRPRRLSVPRAMADAAAVAGTEVAGLAQLSPAGASPLRVPIPSAEPSVSAPASPRGRKRARPGQRSGGAGGGGESGGGGGGGGGGGERQEGPATPTRLSARLRAVLGSPRAFAVEVGRGVEGGAGAWRRYARLRERSGRARRSHSDDDAGARKRARAAVPMGCEASTGEVAPPAAGPGADAPGDDGDACRPIGASGVPAAPLRRSLSAPAEASSAAASERRRQRSLSLSETANHVLSAAAARDRDRGRRRDRGSEEAVARAVRRERRRQKRAHRGDRSASATSASSAGAGAGEAEAAVADATVARWSTGAGPRPGGPDVPPTPGVVGGAVPAATAAAESPRAAGGTGGDASASASPALSAGTTPDTAGAPLVTPQDVLVQYAHVAVSRGSVDNISIVVAAL